MTQSPSPNQVGQIRAVDLKRRLDEPFSVTLLDVREPFERGICVIPRGESVELAIPMREITSRLDEIRQASGVAPLVVYCHHGVRSMVAARWLMDQGVQCWNLVGGIDAWSTQVDPSTPVY